MQQKAGDIRAQAITLIGLADLASARGNNAAASGHLSQALSIFKRLNSRYDIGRTHARLARVALGEARRRQHITAAAKAWSDIGRMDLVHDLDEESNPP